MLYKFSEIHSDNPVIKEKALKAKYRLLEMICTEKKLNEIIGITNTCNFSSIVFILYKFL